MNRLSKLRAMGSPVTSGLCTLPCDLNHNPKGLWIVQITGETEQQLTMLGPQLVDYLYFYFYFLIEVILETFSEPKIHGF